LFARGSSRNKLPTLVVGLALVAAAPCRLSAGPVQPGEAAGSPVRFFTTGPCRLFDSRDPALGGPNALLAGSRTTVVLANRCGVASSATAAAVNVTVTSPTAAGHLTLFPGGGAVPLISTINYASGATRANNAILALDAAASLEVFVGQATGSVHVIIDVTGYFAAPTWALRTVGDVLEIAYGAGTDYPQYAALHLSSGYLRMHTSSSSWGTSVVLPPTFWSGGQIHQGCAVTTSDRRAGDNLILDIGGTLAGVSFSGSVTLSPPDRTFVATVSMTATAPGVVLDDRPGEAFKPVFLSSMRIDPNQWDASAATLGSTVVALPTSGWIVHPPLSVAELGLLGGTSQWKSAAPTVRLVLTQAMPATGWVEASTNPNDDNVALWPSATTVLPSWTYTIEVE
jgi:hypothetical protein